MWCLPPAGADCYGRSPTPSTLRKSKKKRGFPKARIAMRALMVSSLLGHASCFLLWHMPPASLIASRQFRLRAYQTHGASLTAGDPAGLLHVRMVSKDKDTSTNAPFEVTWEHEDGSKDTTVAQPLTSTKGEPINAPQPTKAGKEEAERGGGVAHKLKSMLSNLFGGGAKLDKQTLAALGASALLSYGFVSNLSHITCLIIAWCVHGKKTALSPLDPGQWPAFLAVYAIFFAFQNVIRPIRFAISVALTPFFDKIVDFIQAKGSALSGRSLNKPTAFGITVFLVNVVGSFSYLFGGLLVATTLMQVPLLRTVAGV